MTGGVRRFYGPLVSSFRKIMREFDTTRIVAEADNLVQQSIEGRSEVVYVLFSTVST